VIFFILITNLVAGNKNQDLQEYLNALIKNIESMVFQDMSAVLKLVVSLIILIGDLDKSFHNSNDTLQKQSIRNNQVFSTDTGFNFSSTVCNCIKMCRSSKTFD
jgi:hypothetical protein